MVHGKRNPRRLTKGSLFDLSTPPPPVMLYNDEFEEYFVYLDTIVMNLV